METAAKREQLKETFVSLRNPEFRHGPDGHMDVKVILKDGIWHTEFSIDGVLGEGSGQTPDDAAAKALANIELQHPNKWAVHTGPK